MERWKLWQISGCMLDLEVGIPCHAVVPGMFMDCGVNTLDCSPCMGLSLLCSCSLDLSVEQCRFEAQGKPDPVDGVICLGIA